MASWNNLPSVILLEVFSYLDHDDRVRASTTCRHWRGTLFHRNFWQAVHFKLRANDDDSLRRTKFLTSCFASKLRNATLTFDSMDPSCVQEASRVLQELCKNDGIRRLQLRPSHCKLECPRKPDVNTFVHR